MTDTSSIFGTYAPGFAARKLIKAAQKMPVNWFGRRGALFLRKAVLLQGYKILDAKVEGLLLRLYLNDNVSERKFLFLPQFFDHVERTLMRTLLKKGDVFVDVGANAGIYTMTAAPCVGAEGRVISIEPNPAVMDRLSFNARLNKFENRVIIEQSGVSDQAGQFDLVLDHSNLGGSSLVAVRSDQKITVPCYTLLDILNKHGVTRVRGMKVDIEGAEDKALIPFFRDASPALYPEFIILEKSDKDWKQDLNAALMAAGYAKTATTRMNHIWILDNKR